jgi:hypothetical protein
VHSVRLRASVAHSTESGEREVLASQPPKPPSTKQDAAGGSLRMWQFALLPPMLPPFSFVGDRVEWLGRMVLLSIQTPGDAPTVLSSPQPQEIAVLADHRVFPFAWRFALSGNPIGHHIPLFTKRPSSHKHVQPSPPTLHFFCCFRPRCLNEEK